MWNENALTHASLLIRFKKRYTLDIAYTHTKQHRYRHIKQGEGKLHSRRQKTWIQIFHTRQIFNRKQGTCLPINNRNRRSRNGKEPKVYLSHLFSCRLRLKCIRHTYTLQKKNKHNISLLCFGFFILFASEEPTEEVEKSISFILSVTTPYTI